MDRGLGNPAFRAAFFAGAALRRAALGLDIQSNAGKFVTLYYHSVTAAQREGFAWQAAAVAARAVPTSEIGRVDSTAARPSVAVTFDDGFANLLDNAVPSLVEHKVPATIFAVSANLGRKPAWRIPAGDADAGETVMTAAQLRSLPADLITIGSHTATHRRLDDLSVAEVERELNDSKAALEDVLGRPVTALAFPHGAYDERSVRAAYEAGYEQLFHHRGMRTPGAAPDGPYRQVRRFAKRVPRGVQHANRRRVRLALQRETREEEPRSGR